MASERTSFRQVLAFAVGGGWGSETPSNDSTPVRVIRGTDFKDVQFGNIDRVPFRYEQNSKLVNRTVREGDILLEISGGSSARGQSTGRTLFISAQVLELLGRAVIPASFCRLLRVDTQLIKPVFAYYWLQEMYASRRAASYENQSTGLSNFQFSKFLDLESIELPSLSLQVGVANVLDSLDQRIANLYRTSKILENIAQTFFKSWFVDFDPVRAKAEGREPEGMDAATAALFPSSFTNSEADQLPLGWTIDDLGNRVLINPIRRLPRGVAATYLDMANVPVTGPTPQAVIQRNVGSGCKFVNGDTLFAKITPCLENGKTAFVDFLGDGEIGWGSTELIVLSPSRPIPPQFAYLLARDASFRGFAERGMTGTSGRQRVAPEHLKRYKFTFATDDIYRAFDSITKPLFKRIRTNADMASTLQDIRDTLLPRLISGKLRIPDAEKLVASAL